MLQIKLEVLDSSLPCRFGIPIDYDEAQASTANWRIITAAGTPVPAAYIVNSRWDGSPVSGNRIKHAQAVVLAPSSGTYYLTDTAGPIAALPPLTLNIGSDHEVINNRVRIVLAGATTTPLLSFKLDGNETLSAQGGQWLGNSINLEAFKVTAISVFEQSALHIVVRQEGYFEHGGIRDHARLHAEIYWTVFAGDFPAVLVNLRLINNELDPNAYLASPNGPINFTQLVFKLNTASAATAQLTTCLTNAEATALSQAVAIGTEHIPTKATVNAGALELSVVEFAERFPVALEGTGSTLTYSMLPTQTAPNRFHPDIACTWNCYIGAQTANATKLVTDPQVLVDPVYVARTNVYQCNLMPRFDWQLTDVQGDSTQLLNFQRAEKHFAIDYDVNEVVPAPGWSGIGMSNYEKRWSAVVYGPGSLNNYNEWYGWDKFGNQFDQGQGYIHGIYDQPRHHWRQWFRTGNIRSYRLASIESRYMADNGTVWSAIPNSGNVGNIFLGRSWYEQTPVIGFPGSTTPQATHTQGDGISIAARYNWPIAKLSEAIRFERAASYNYDHNGTVFTGVDGSWDSNENNGRGWPVLICQQAYNWTGNTLYRDKVLQYLTCTLKAESLVNVPPLQGFYAAKGISGNPVSEYQFGPFIWAGYQMCSFFEGLFDLRRRGVPNAALEALAVRICDWIFTGNAQTMVPQIDRPLKGGTIAGTDITPYEAHYQFKAGVAQTDTPAVSLSFQLLAAVELAYWLTGRADLMSKRDMLFRSIVQHWDANRGARPISLLGPITCRRNDEFGTAQKAISQLNTHAAYTLGSILRSPSIAAPSLSALAPLTGPVGTAVTLTLTGTGFIQGGMVRFGSFLIAPTSVTATTVIVAVPANSVLAGAIPVCYENPNHKVTAKINYNDTPLVNPLPTLTTVTPSSVVEGSPAQLVTLTGTNFLPTTTATYNGAARAVTYISSTQIQVALLAGDLVAASTGTLQAANPAPGGGASNTLPFTVTAIVLNPAPAISSTSPSSVAAGSGSQLVTITGTGFISGVTTLTINGLPVILSVSSPTSATFILPSTATLVPGNVSVFLANPAPGGGTASTSIAVVASNPAPTLNAISPTNALTNSGSIMVMLSGSGFTPNSVVTYNGLPLTTTYISGTMLSVTIVAPATPGTGIFAVVNPAPGGGTSGQQTITFIDAPVVEPGFCAAELRVKPLDNCLPPVDATHFPEGALIWGTVGAFNAQAIALNENVLDCYRGTVVIDPYCRDLVEGDCVRG